MKVWNGYNQFGPDYGYNLYEKAVREDTIVKSLEIHRRYKKVFSIEYNVENYLSTFLKVADFKTVVHINQQIENALNQPNDDLAKFELLPDLPMKP